MLETANPEVLNYKRNELEEIYTNYSFLQPIALQFNLALEKYDKMLANQSSWKSYVHI